MLNLQSDLQNADNSIPVPNVKSQILSSTFRASVLSLESRHLVSGIKDKTVRREFCTPHITLSSSNLRIKYDGEPTSTSPASPIGKARPARYCTASATVSNKCASAAASVAPAAVPSALVRACVCVGMLFQVSREGEQGVAERDAR